MGVFSRDKFRLNYFNRLILTIHVIVLLIAYTIFLNKIFAPTQIPYFNFISIGFPIIFVILMLFMLHWLLFSWRHFVLMLILSSGIFYSIYLSYPLYNFSKKSTEVPNLSVMTYNTHGFKADGTEKFIEEHLTDIMFFQEGGEKSHKNWKAKKLKDYYAEHYAGLSVYSKYPIIQAQITGSEDPSNSGIALIVDLDLDTDTIRVINLYMEPMYIDKTLVKDVILSDTTEEIEESSKKIESKLLKGMKVHMQQLDNVIPFIQKSSHPVLLASDLNSTPGSYEYETVTKYLDDSYILAGKGNATTFHGFKFPIRIDYLFHSKEFEVVDAKVIRKKFSDHFPVIINYKLHK